MKTYFIKGISTDPYFNIASEQYLLERKGDFFVYLWINAPAVIVGVNQNTAEEVNLDYTQKNGVKVVRRMTGGGAVYHDENNVCYTIIAPYEGGRDNYRYFTEGVIGYLNSIGVKAEFSGRNDLTVDGKKFSGNAQRIYKNRLMHHGTLLFDTDVKALENTLKPSKLKVESKGIKSIRARVTNLKFYMPDKDVGQFYNELCEYFSKGLEEYFFTDEDKAEIDKLIQNKYSKYEWNVGYSPSASYFGERKFPFGIVNVSFDVIAGKLDNVRFTGDFFSTTPISVLEERLIGVPLDREELSHKLADVDKYVNGATAEDVISLFFGC